jgi:hypothetical protein
VRRANLVLVEAVGLGRGVRSANRHDVDPEDVFRLKLQSRLDAAY